MLNSWNKVALHICGVMAISVSAANLFTNGDFETTTSGWTKYLQSGTPVAGTLAFDGSSVHTGAKAAHFNVSATSTENWHAQFQFPSQTLGKGKAYTLKFWAKGPGSIHLGIADASYAYLTGFTFNLSSEWKQYTGTLIGDGTLRRMAAYLALQTGDYYFDDMSLEETGVLDSTWYNRADQRIDSLRKKDFGVRLLGSNNTNVPLQIKLIQHQFPFGTALSFGNTANETWYKQTAAKYFWAGVLENDFKWPGYEASQGVVNDAQVKAYLDWTESQNWRLMRGHALEWGITQYGFDTHWARTGTREQYLAALKTRIQRDMAEYQGRFQQYDVWNEAFHETSLFDKWGLDLLDSALIWARAADPTAKLYLNEYSVVAGGETEVFFNLVKGLQDRGIPLDGIGVQCHFFNPIIDPATIAMRLDRLAQLGLPIMVTEYDMGSLDAGLTLTPSQQAVEVSKFIRSAFSHPAVQGIILWGFWDSRHWITNGGLFEEDMSPKPAADSVYALWHNEWTTQVSLNSDENGLVAFRGFPGTYEVSYNGKKDTLEFGDTLVWDLNGTQNPVALSPQNARENQLQISLFDLQGRQVYQGPISLQAALIGVAHLPSLKPGLYLYSGRTLQVK